MGIVEPMPACVIPLNRPGVQAFREITRHCHEIGKLLVVALRKEKITVDSIGPWNAEEDGDFPVPVSVPPVSHRGEILIDKESDVSCENGE